MGNRKQPTPLPTNQVKPEPPPPPPPKKCDHEISTRMGGAALSVYVHRCSKCGWEWMSGSPDLPSMPKSTHPPKPPEPQNRIIKESHIPPRTDGHVSWWRRLVVALGYAEGER
jgi:hypothetical protein